MHLSSLQLKRFRSCENVVVKLHPSLTVLVGENNGGKSNLIDALRLIIAPLSGRRDRYADDDDIRRSTSIRSFEIQATYDDLSETLRGMLIGAIPDLINPQALFGLRYEGRSDRFPRGKSTWWAGRFENNTPESGASDLIKHVYLPPLRDAHQSLGTASGSRVFALLRHFVPEGEQAAFLAELRRPAQNQAALNAINRDIQATLEELTSGLRKQQAAVNFSDETMFDIARDLRFRLSDAGVALEDIRCSGLGYANLLYIATVIVELAKATDADLTTFLVEEPEAHLHPQLQVLLLEFLLAQAEKSARREPRPGKPEGRIQIVVTTHSPNLTAWVSPEHLVVVRTAEENLNGQISKHTRCIPIASLGVKQKTLAKVARYLDVTRSALLFGNRAILVEGIAEALLLPVVARRLLLAGGHERWLRFKACVIAPIEGVDFRPYVEILLRGHELARIADRLIVITDADPRVEGNRVVDLENLAHSLGAGDCLTVLSNQQTLEHEIFSAGNEAILKKAFLRTHRRSLGVWNAEVANLEPDRRPAAFIALLEGRKVRKGDFAQTLASLIQAGEPFNSPVYLSRAIELASAP